MELVFEMQLLNLPIEGCYLINVKKTVDERGSFEKLFHKPTFKLSGLEDDFAECYVTKSHRGVIRGMHFQEPPSDHSKLVSCIGGRVRDGLVDLRKGSPTFGHSTSLILCEDEATAIYIPRGVAHGFAAHSDDSVILYMVGSAYDPLVDNGVRWDSIGIDWWAGSSAPEKIIISNRDQNFIKFNDFVTPFTIACNK